MPIYLDNNATTALAPKVKEAMELDFGPVPLNPSSVHTYGRKAKALLREARKTCAEALHTRPSQIYFTSGGTEALNWAISTLCTNHIITTHIEHPAVTHTILATPKKITYLPVTSLGAPTLESITQAWKPGCSLVLSAVNTETGALLDLEAIAAFADHTKTPLIIDGVALLGKGPFVLYPGITAIAFSGHKFHGPKGIGLLITTKEPTAYLHGGGQEMGQRSGTENLAGILGIAKACTLLDPKYFHHMQHLRDHFEANLPEAIVNGSGPRISNVSNLYFPHIDGETLLIKLDLEGVMAAQGSACSSGALEPSRVLTEMGYPKERVLRSLRFSLSRYTTLSEIEKALKIIHRLTARKKTSLSL